MNSSTKIALVITLLDAMGIGLIMPVLPTLLREFIASEDIANHFGVLLALYALELSNQVQRFFEVNFIRCFPT